MLMTYLRDMAREGKGGRWVSLELGPGGKELTLIRYSRCVSLSSLNAHSILVWWVPEAAVKRCLPIPSEILFL